MFEFNDRNPLPVIGEEALVRNVARHGLGQLDHAIDQRDVFFAHARHQAGAKDGNDHGESPLANMLAQPIAIRQFRF
jgi:hypothetical protein